MSNARNLSNLLGTGTEIQTGKIANSAITEAKLHTTLDLSSKTLTMPSGVSLFKRAYHADMGSTPIQWVAGWTTLLTINNVVVNSGEKVYLSYVFTARHTSSGQHHTAYRAGYSGSASGAVGDSGWGLGINDIASSGWQLDTSFVCLNTFPSDPFNSTGTFTFTIQGRSSNTSGYWNAEGNGVHTGYTNGVCTIYVGE